MGLSDNIKAQVLAVEVVDAHPGRFDEESLKQQFAEFLGAGSDDDDRVEALRLSVRRAHRRTPIDEIVKQAQEILDWQPKRPAPVVPAPVVTRKKKTRNRKL